MHLASCIEKGIQQFQEGPTLPGRATSVDDLAFWQETLQVKKKG